MHQYPLVQTVVGTNLLLHIFIKTNLLERPIPTTKHQLSKRHQSLCMSGTNLQLTIFLLHVMITLTLPLVSLIATYAFTSSDQNLNL
jgi:hypothetical protein